ncbi:hypothetical protein, partial [Caldibacillus thermoamylovorans]|uniref:hypothetical protein n=1 Tax=Caldibacillus thermoamylovorans TaxID=35841 RepID=UPI001F1916D1
PRRVSFSSKMHSHFLRAMSIRGSKSVLIAGRSSLYVAKRALCAFLSISIVVITYLPKVHLYEKNGAYEHYVIKTKIKG